MPWPPALCGADRVVPGVSDDKLDAITPGEECWIGAVNLQ
jgi:hypothetical protein